MAVIFISLLTPPASKGDDFLNAERRIDSITAISSGLTLRRLKSMADSLHMSDNHNAKREAQSWYMAAMERTAKGMSEKDWEIMAGIHSNYASYLYYNDNNSVLAFPGYTYREGTLRQQFRTLLCLRDPGKAVCQLQQ